MDLHKQHSHLVLRCKAAAQSITCSELDKTQLSASNGDEVLTAVFVQAEHGPVSCNLL